MNHSALFRVLTLIALPALLQPASAGLVSLDSVHGASTVTLDTTSRLRWLDPGVTESLSYNEIVALLSTDFRYKGYRFAKMSELEELFRNASILDINNPGYGALFGTTANVPGAKFLQSHLGVTYSYQYSANGFLFETAGYLDDPFASTINGFVSAHIGNVVIRTDVATPSGRFDFASAYSTWGSVPTGSTLQGVGGWLVQQNVVAEPPFHCDDCIVTCPACHHLPQNRRS